MKASEAAPGPSPCPVRPWQGVHFAANTSLPLAGSPFSEAFARRAIFKAKTVINAAIRHVIFNICFFLLLFCSFY
jgi:hypothetical protein